MVDLFTVIPIWVTAGQTCPTYNDISSFGDGVLYLMFLLNTTQILRALRIRRKLVTIEDPVDRCIGEICLTITITILFYSAVMEFLEETTQPNPFHTWSYYSVITITTVGYGDFTPKSTLGRIAAMVCK